MVGEMAVLKGIDSGDKVTFVVDEMSSRPAILVPTDVNVVTKVAKVVTVTVVSVERVVSRVVVGKIVVGSRVLGVIGISGVVFIVVAIVLMVAIVVLSGASVGTNGNFGHGFTICGPNILSNT